MHNFSGSEQFLAIMKHSLANMKHSAPYIQNVKVHNYIEADRVVY